VEGQHSRNRKAGRRADSCDPGYRDVEGSCEHGYEPLGLIKRTSFSSKGSSGFSKRTGRSSPVFRTNTTLPFHGINVLTHNQCDFNMFFVSCKFLMSVTGHEDVQRIGGTAPYILNFNKQ